MRKISLSYGAGVCLGFLCQGRHRGLRKRQKGGASCVKVAILNCINMGRVRQAKNVANGEGVKSKSKMAAKNTQTKEIQQKQQTGQKE